MLARRRRTGRRGPAGPGPECVILPCILGSVCRTSAVNIYIHLSGPYINCLRRSKGAGHGPAAVLRGVGLRRECGASAEAVGEIGRVVRNMQIQLGSGAVSFKWTGLNNPRNLARSAREQRPEIYNSSKLTAFICVQLWRRGARGGHRSRTSTLTGRACPNTLQVALPAVAKTESPAGPSK